VASRSWAARNERARAAGYKNYYDYRAHNYGKSPPSAPRARGSELAMLRGHRSAADLERLIQSGRVELVNTVTTVNTQGRVGVDVLVALSNGETREFRLNFKQAQAMGQLVDDLGADAPPIVGSPRTLARFADVREAEFDEPDDFEEFESDAATH
jgi:hypothetical protein